MSLHGPPHVVGIDPGFAACGLAVIELGSGREHVERLDVVRTKKSDRKRGIMVSDDEARRTMEIARRIHEIVDEHVVAICAEAFSSPRSSRTARQLGMTWGVLGAVSVVSGVPILSVSPKEIKQRLCGRASASKKDVQAALVKRYGELDLPDPPSVHEHACDALAAIVACLDAPAIMMARRML